MDKMVRWVLVSLVILFQKQCLALKCLECVDVPHPSYCDKVATCRDGASCGLTKYITSSGAVLFSSGCISNTTCSYLSQADSAEDESLDVITCKECCSDRDFCNIEGCGQPGIQRDNRGPYCYECHVENEKYGCRTVTQCDMHEACYLETGRYPGTFKSGCTDHTNCSVTSVPQQHKRSLTVSLPFCCTGDFCNDISKFVGPDPQPVNGGWSSWSVWSSCSHTCGSNSVRSRNRMCDNPSPLYNGLPCQGLGQETELCPFTDCTQISHWLEWSSWSECVGPCSGTKQYRFRNCSGGGGGCRHEHGNSHDRRSCTNTHHCSDARCKLDDGFQIVMVGSERLCLRLSVRAYTWSVSRDRCRDRGGDLVSIGNRDVDYAIRTFLQGKLVPWVKHGNESLNYTWFGLHYVNNYYQWTNTQVPYTYNAFPHEPSHHRHCVMGGGEVYERWYNENCHELYHYLCEITLN